MKERIISTLLGLTVLLMLTSCAKREEKKKAYIDYYYATEILLTDIDIDYNWSTEIADAGETKETEAYYTAVSNLRRSHTLSNYQTYFKCAEKLLDFLEDKYGWVDTTGEGDAYIHYAYTYHKVKNL